TAGSPSDRLVGLVLGRPGEQLRRRLTPSLHGEPLWPRYDSPTISPFSSRAICAAAGFADRPGIVRMSPPVGETKPATPDARTSRTGSVHPVGAPLSAGSEEIDRCVLAMHTGRRPNPARS